MSLATCGGSGSIGGVDDSSHLRNSVATAVAQSSDRIGVHVALVMPAQDILDVGLEVVSHDFCAPMLMLQVVPIAPCRAVAHEPSPRFDRPVRSLRCSVSDRLRSVVIS